MTLLPLLLALRGVALGDVAELMAHRRRKLGLVVQQSQQPAGHEHVAARQRVGVGDRLVENEEAVAARHARRVSPAAGRRGRPWPAARVSDRPARPSSRLARQGSPWRRRRQRPWSATRLGVQPPARSQQRQENGKNREKTLFLRNARPQLMRPRAAHANVREAGTRAPAMALIEPENRMPRSRPLFVLTCFRRSRPTPAACWRSTGGTRSTGSRAAIPTACRWCSCMAGRAPARRRCIAASSTRSSTGSWCSTSAAAAARCRSATCTTTPRRIWSPTWRSCARHLGIARWLLFGGSWGSTLALAYGLRHPERTTGFILRGIFLGTQSEIDWFLHGMRRDLPRGLARLRRAPAGRRARRPARQLSIAA